MRFVGGHPVLRAVAGAGATVSLFRGMVGVAILLYLVHGLRLTPVLLGPLCAVGGISAVLGAAAASRLLRRWGLGRTMVSSLLLASVAGLCLPLAGGPVWLIVGLLAAQQLCGDGAATVYEIAAVSLRQAVTLDRLQGRVHATFQVIAGAAQLTGLLAGGALGSTIGLRLTLGLGVGGSAFAALWLLASPVRSLHAYPPTASSST